MKEKNDNNIHKINNNQKNIIIKILTFSIIIAVFIFATNAIKKGTYSSANYTVTFKAQDDGVLKTVECTGTEFCPAGSVVPPISCSYWCKSQKSCQSPITSNDFKILGIGSNLVYYCQDNNVTGNTYAIRLSILSEGGKWGDNTDYKIQKIVNYNTSKSANELPCIYKRGYKLDGWYIYENNSLTEKVTTVNSTHNEKLLKPKWTKVNDDTIQEYECDLGEAHMYTVTFKAQDESTLKIDKCTGVEFCPAGSIVPPSSCSKWCGTKTCEEPKTSNDFKILGINGSFTVYCQDSSVTGTKANNQIEVNQNAENDNQNKSNQNTETSNQIEVNQNAENDNQNKSNNETQNNSVAYSNEINGDRCYNGTWVRVMTCQPASVNGAQCKLKDGTIVLRSNITLSSGCQDIDEAYTDAIDDYRCNKDSGKWIYISTCQPNKTGAKCKTSDSTVLRSSLTNGNGCTATKPDSNDTYNNNTNQNNSKSNSNENYYSGQNYNNSTNPQTGTFEFVIFTAIGIIALIVSQYYIRKSRLLNIK